MLVGERKNCLLWCNTRLFFEPKYYGRPSALSMQSLKRKCSSNGAAYVGAPTLAEMITRTPYTRNISGNTSAVSATPLFLLRKHD